MSSSLISTLKPPVAPRAPQAPHRAWLGVSGLFGLVALGLGSAWLAGRWLAMQANADAGYWVGVAGGLAMLALFAYPLRKRARWMRHAGSTRHWFVAHMVLGLAGPWLILVHCGGRFGSLNAAVALFAMAVVAASGVVGRFLYVRVHLGLSGERARLAQWQAALGHERAGLAAGLAQAPQARNRLLAFEQTVLAGPGAALPAWRLLTLAWPARQVLRAVEQELAAALAQAGVSAAQQRRDSAPALAQAHQHVALVLKVAQFALWERLFALWHVLHTPFVHVMVLCALAHVVAVHAY